MSEIEKAKAEMKKYQASGNYFGYKQAMKHYERLRRKEARQYGERNGR